MKISELMAIVLYGMVGVISLMMAYKNLVSDRFIPFQEKAAGTSWNSIDSRLQYVLLTLMRVSGLGFLVIGILLLVTPIVSYFRQDEFLRYAIPILSFIYCSGLFLINYKLYKQTKATTPWKGSLFALVTLLVGLILSML